MSDDNYAATIANFEQQIEEGAFNPDLAPESQILERVKLEETYLETAVLPPLSEILKYLPNQYTGRDTRSLVP